MPKAPRTRQACDRCHGQKLRCPKNPASVVCTRCAKAGTPCVFSPIGGPQCRSPGEPLSTPSFPHLQDQPLDWSLLAAPTLDFGACLTVGMPDLNTLANHSSLSAPEDNGRQIGDGGQPPPSTTERLSTLIVSLDHAMRSLPNRSLLHLPRNAAPDTYRERLAQAKTSYPVSFESAFAAAQMLVDVYPAAFGDIFVTSFRDSDCSLDDCIHRIPLPEGYAPPESPYLPTDGIDGPLLSLLVTCHMRLLDIVDLMFYHMRTCHKTALAYPSDNQPSFDVPGLKIGSFTPSKESTTAMHVILFAHLLSRLDTEASKLSKAIQESLCSHGQLTKEGQLMKLQCDLLAEKATSKCRELKAMREVLAKENVIIT